MTNQDLHFQQNLYYELPSILVSFINQFILGL